jgi:hypothetical protein
LLIGRFSNPADCGAPCASSPSFWSGTGFQRVVAFGDDGAQHVADRRGEGEQAIMMLMVALFWVLAAAS